MTVIDKFENDTFWLSNFYPCIVKYKNVDYPSSEAAYQSAKCPGHEAEFSHFDAKTAKHFGRKYMMREDWEDVKDTVMYDILKVKFSEPLRRKRLIDTYPATLIEGNTWNDTYWGVCNGVGQNKLGKLLMKVREEAMSEDSGKRGTNFRDF